MGRKVQFRNKWGWFEFLIRAALDGRFIPTSDLADHRAAQVQTQAAAPPVAGASPPARQHSAVWQAHQNELARLFPPSEVGINLSPLRALEDEHAIWLEALNSFVAERVRAQLTTDRNRNEAPYVTTASGSHRLKIGILSHPIPSMTKRHDVLATFRQMAEAFPHTFFAKSADVQPLKIGIATDLLAALPPGVEAHEVKRFLGWYVNRPVYLKALAQGAGRVDLTGAVVDTDIPEEVRSQAKQRLEAAQQGPATFPRRTGAMAKPAPAALLNLEELYAMAIEAKLEMTLKFSTLPQAKPAGAGKMAFALKTPDGQFVTAVINNKTWNKLVKANADWPSWVAALTGAMGERTGKGFRLANPGLQVFERKTKAADVPATTDTPPASSEPFTPPPSAAPVTITTSAGTATVTKRAPLSLQRNVSAKGTPG